MINTKLEFKELGKSIAEGHKIYLVNKELSANSGRIYYNIRRKCWVYQGSDKYYLSLEDLQDIINFINQLK